MINITKKEDCCGCTACYSICPLKAISMKSDNEGFMYPHIDSNKCTNCGLCDKVCPIINVKSETVFPQKAYIVQHKNSSVRSESTSGGAFTAIAEYVISKDGIVFGAGFNEDFIVIHQYAETVEELGKFRNSKYVQSEVRESYSQVKKFLDDGKLVCFSGTPCQIEGLISYLRKPYDNLITVDVVCHAIPSPLVWSKYKQLRARNRKIQSALFRDKQMYGYNYSQISMSFEDETIHNGVESDPYLRAFFHDISDRPSCYSCRFKKRYRVSDITLWDCFDVYKFSKEFDDNKGTTRALIHTEKGRNIFESIKENCKLCEINADDAVAGVREISASVKCNPVREQFFADINSMSPENFFCKYFPDTVKVKAERFTRRLCNKLGIYSAAKKLYVKIIKK